MRFTIFTTLLLISLSACAKQSISLTSANAMALEHNYELANYPFQIRQQSASRLQAGVTPSPEVELVVDDLVGTNQYGLFEQSELSLVFSQTIEMGDKRHLRQAHIASVGDRLQLELSLAKLDVLAENSRRYYQVLKLQELQKILIQKIEFEKNMLLKVKTLVKAGAVGMVDQAVISLRLKRSEAKLLALESQHSVAKNRLSAMWQKTATFDRVQGNLNFLPILPTKQQVVASLANSPAVFHLLALQREADVNLNLIKESSKADLSFSGGITHKQFDNTQTISVGISVPLYFSNPNKGRIQKAVIELQKSQALSLYSKTKLELLLIQHWQKMQLYQQQFKQLKQQILPEVERLMALVVKNYKHANISVLQVVDAQQQWLDLKIDLIEQASLIYTELLELERLTASELGK